MDRESIIAALERGLTVCWSNHQYEVRKLAGTLKVCAVSNSNVRRTLIDAVLNKCFISNSIL